MSRKIPFKISARTARLIGRQNFPNAEGAIIELVKNSYDADANTCIVVFDNQYAVLPTQLLPAKYTQFVKEEILISKYYHFAEHHRQDNYIFEEPDPQTDQEREEINAEKQTLKAFFQSKCKLYIIDNGEGMTDKIIEDFWMTIGTNNKEQEIFTRKGRIKTGEKGIGRFALDKLGDLAEMLTKPDPETYPSVTPNHAFLWQINWNDFNGDGKVLGDVEADLIAEELLDFSQDVVAILPSQAHKTLNSTINTFTTGTSIQIGKLRDEWNDRAVGKLFTNLEVLIPPREERIFDIFLFSTLNPEKYGKVSPSICDDYDYKVEARVDANGIAEITIDRNEFDVTKFPDDLFDREAMKGADFTKTAFEQGRIVITRHITELVPGLSNIDTGDILSNIGSFEFIFYFMKARTSKKNREVFLYKNFSSAPRKKWFEQFGGIKLFRDNFRVRPYGEVSGPAFDWLQLGGRAGRSPSSIGQEGRGGWLVRPNQITGIINISRLTNISFEDTSSRYGLQENRTLSYFTQIIKGILGVFEKDRSYIGRALRVFYDETHQDEVTEEQAETVKERVKERKTKRGKVKAISQAEEDAEILVSQVESLEKQIEELQGEAKLLEILASSGLVIASFTHELKNIEDNLVFRIDELGESFQPVVNMEECNKLPDFLNPFTMLNGIKNEDIKLKEWLHYSLETLRRDKRRRPNVDLLNYLPKYRESWRMACYERGVTFNLILPQREELKIRVFEAELDSIFNNLLINSFEAFLKSNAPPEREITVKLKVHNADVQFLYTDSGPGLSKDIVNPYWIFEPHKTTKKDVHTGEDTGTGIGMWLVKSLVEGNNGTIDFIEKQAGFGLSIKLLNKVR